MAKIEKIPDSNGKGFTLVTVAEDVERVSPVEYYRANFVESNKAKREALLQARIPHFPIAWARKSIEKEVTLAWEVYYEQIMLLEVPPFLFSALKTDNRKYQEKFLRDMQFTPEQLLAFYFRAYQEKGFTFSSYSAEHLPTGTELRDMPVLVRVNGEEIEKSGETVLTNGQLKQAVLQRSGTYGKILDKGDNWHCFFITLESAAGEENWRDGQPHYHYISDKFGVSREEVVKQLKNKDYNLSGLPHLKLLGYRDQSSTADK